MTKRYKNVCTDMPTNRAELAGWLHDKCGLDFPLRGACAGHDSPLDYLCHSFFEESPGDCVVWANRGGGKTFVGAVATLLDMLFKPGIQVRILAGSLEQAGKMLGYLRGLIEAKFAGKVAGKIGKRSIRLTNGSRVEVLAQSEKSVRGTRVHKLRCDEVELFSREIWNAAQLVTKSAGGKKVSSVRCPVSRKEKKGGELQTHGSVEVFSTMHVPGGLMSEITAAARASGKRVFTWCAWDVMNRCAPERPCEGCVLQEGCQGRARNGGGFLHVEDVIAMKSRVSQPVWENEVLCLPPKREDAVFARFSRDEHVRQHPLDRRLHSRNIVGLDFGYAGAFAAVFVALTGEGDAARAHVRAEFVRARATLQKNVESIREIVGGDWPHAVHVDPAGVAVNPQTGVSDIRLLRDAGFHVKYRPQRIEPGLQLLERLLCPALGNPRLTIDPACTHLIAALENYRWQTARSANSGGAGGGPLKDGVHDHILDALRYALTGELLPGGKTEMRQY